MEGTWGQAKRNVFDGESGAGWRRRPSALKLERKGRHAPMHPCGGWMARRRLHGGASPIAGHGRLTVAASYLLLVVHRDRAALRARLLDCVPAKSSAPPYHLRIDQKSSMPGVG